MRWPFGPPHMTLKPSKKTPKNKTNKKTKKEKRRNKKKTRKHKKYSKMSFSVIIENFLLFWVGVQNFPFLTTWPKKRAPKKHYKNRGFRAFFFKADVRHETAIFGPKNPKFINSSYHFFLPVFFSFNNTKHKILLKPLFL